MKGSTQGYSRTGNAPDVVVLDTGALLTWAALAMEARLVTTPGVLGEVRDERSRLGLELLESSGKLSVVEPGDQYVARAREAAGKAGVKGRLSSVDLEVLAAGIMLASSGLRVAIATDDGALARAAAAAGLTVYRIRYRRARR